MLWWLLFAVVDHKGCMRLVISDPWGGVAAPCIAEPCLPAESCKALHGDNNHCHGGHNRP
jgi:hypothetical protein